MHLILDCLSPRQSLPERSLINVMLQEGNASLVIFETSEGVFFHS